MTSIKPIAKRSIEIKYLLELCFSFLKIELSTRLPFIRHIFWHIFRLSLIMINFVWLLWHEVNLLLWLNFGLILNIIVIKILTIEWILLNCIWLCLLLLSISIPTLIKTHNSKVIALRHLIAFNLVLLVS